MSDFGFELDLDFETEIQECDVLDVEDITEPKVKLGDIWLLGEHRLMCGDSCNAVDVAKLMNGAIVDLWLTDPPYNVNYEGQNGMSIQNDNMTDSDFKEFLNKSFSIAVEYLKHGGAFYIWHADSEGFNFRQAVKSQKDLLLKQCLIWVKNSLVLGRQDYQWQHEPCLYGWKAGAKHYFTDSRNETTVIEENKPQRNDDHPTMKPINLFAKLISNSSKKGEIVLDTFAGSGTTVLACEQLNRIAYVMELEPKYCDIIINRWEELTGNRARKLNG